MYVIIKKIYLILVIRKLKSMTKINFLNKQIFFFFLEQRIKVKFELILVLLYENKVQTLVITFLLVTFN